MNKEMNTTLNTTPRMVSFDAECESGIWSRAFSIAGIAYDEFGQVVDSFIGRCPIEGEVSDYVRDEVLPKMTGVEENFGSYEELLRAFFAWRAPYKKTKFQELAHVGVPVEAKLYMDAYKAGLIGEWDGPFPLVDPSAIPEIGTSVDTYNEIHGCGPNPEDFAGGTHNPLYDSAAAYAAYRHWLLNR